MRSRKVTAGVALVAVGTVLIAVIPFPHEARREVSLVTVRNVLALLVGREVHPRYFARGVTRPPPRPAV